MRPQAVRRALAPGFPEPPRGRPLRERVPVPSVGKLPRTGHVRRVAGARDEFKLRHLPRGRACAGTPPVIVEDLQDVSDDDWT